MNKEGHGRLKVSVLVLLVITIMVVVIAFMFFRLKDDSNNLYKNVNIDNKTIGTLVNEIDEGDLGYIALHYPSFEDEILNNTIKEYLETIKANVTKNNNINMIYFLDYESEVLFENFTLIKFNYKVINKENNEESITSMIINYDNKSKKILKTNDILRLDYTNILYDLCTKANISVKNEKASFEYFKLNKDKVTFYFNNYKDQVDLKYADYKKYIKINNVNIPSLAPTNIVTPKKRVIDPKKPMVALTYDDGPSGVYTTAMLDVLAKEDISATFFILGNRAIQYPDIIKRQFADGHQIASHGFDHKSLLDLDYESTKKQMFDTSDAVFSLTGYDVNYVRASFGIETDNLHKLYDDNHTVLWTIDTRDWHSRSKDKIKHDVLENLADGSIILMHDMYDASIEATKELIPLLREKGYQMVTVEELMNYKYNK